MKSSILLILAGPNGSGKSTVTDAISIQGEYVNADEIQAYLNCSPLKAAEIAENTREYLLSQGKSFTFETVLSTPRNIDLAKRAKQAGYYIICIYVLTTDPEINKVRFEKRHRNGGHDVPPEKIVDRYHRAMRLFPQLFDFCNELYVYDNSLERTEGEPHMIISFRSGIIEYYPSKVWTQDMLDCLCNGTYAP